MHIYTVTYGDSVWSISIKYNVPVDSIVYANGLTPPYTLAIGESLVIPQTRSRHVVRAGQSLWTIAQLYNVSVPALAYANQISPSSVIQPGQVLIIPAESKLFGSIETNGYIEPTGNLQRELKIVDDTARYLTYISVFSYRVQDDGSIISPPNDQAIIDRIKRNGSAPLMVLTNFRGGTFDTQLAGTILNNPQIQNTLIRNIVSTLRSKGFRGINIDFERVPPEDRDRYTDFIKKVRAAIKPQFIISTALAPKTSGSQVGAWYEAHDYGAHGSIVDFVVLMTYEWGWSGGPPMAVAPIDQVSKVLNYAVSVIPRSKIMMGMPLYGYDWTLPYMPGGRFARRVSPIQATQLAVKEGSNIEFDAKAQSPYFHYYDNNGNRHEVWFEDARSVYSKFRLANAYRIRGVSYWVLGSDFPQNWYELEDLFIIKKLT